MSSRPRLPCRFFSTPRGCQRGDACTFLHDRSRSEHQAAPQRKKAPLQDDLLRWSALIPKSSNARGLGRVELANLFRQAHALVVQGNETRQAVITRLASEGGLIRMNEIIETIERAEDCQARVRDGIFSDMVLPLLEILSDKGVLSSLLLEISLGTILNFLFGVNGRRSITLYHFIVSVLEQLDKNNSSYDRAIALDASLIVLSRIVDLNGSAMIIPEFKTFTDAFASLLGDIDGISNLAPLLRAETSLARTQQRLGLGTTLPTMQARQHVTTTRPTFKLSCDGPGHLSREGPRHDNDFESIKQIKIMPTALEIESHRLEYLPSVDPSQLHIDGVDGLLDRHFRLLREDTVGQLRDAIRIELERQRNVQEGIPNTGSHQQGARTHVYPQAQMIDLKFHKIRGLDLVYRFAQPHAVQKMTSKTRRNWWHASKRLQLGALVCLIESRGNPMFCSVSHTGLTTEEDSKQKQPAEEVPAWLNVIDNDEQAFVILTLVDTDTHNLGLALKNYDTPDAGRTQALLEFPGVLLPSFQPTLQALQRMTGGRDFPFANILAPTTAQPGTLHEISPPAYASRPNFKFDLGHLVGGRPLELSVQPGQKFDADNLRKYSSLDEAQAEALVHALQRNFALIQGPPGTGKSYTGIAIIKTLLASASKAHLGPIICVCYTNHALDQLLEHLHDHGVDQIVRVGSRSKSEVLQQLSLRKITSAMERTKTEKSSLWALTKRMEELLLEVNGLLQAFVKAEDEANIRKYLDNNYPHHSKELFSKDAADEEGFRVVVNYRASPLESWLSCRNMTTTILRRRDRSIKDLVFAPLMSMTRSERLKLYTAWVTDLKKSIRSQIDSLIDDYLDVRAQTYNARQELDLRCLQEAKVIGVTTTGLARITNLMGRLEAKILICEEAGEVLEAHTLTTLLPSIEHMILIGDHLQLRPQTQNYDLQSDNPRGKQFSLDMSLFERLVQPPVHGGPAFRMPLSILETQRRMHPSISALIRRTLYPMLKDGGFVGEYPQVFGMRRRLFWFDHQHPEAKQAKDQIATTSQSNDFEVAMVAALVAHLVRQGAYRSEDIAVLTPYLGQLSKLRIELGKTHAVVVDERDIVQLENTGLNSDQAFSALAPEIAKTTLLRALRIATVDNFQGEEAKVVVVSLVRSNEENKCGFLRTSNRINVLLSRAKHGMYIFGNSRTSNQVPMWANVIEQLREGSNLGSSLELCCSRHQDTIISVKTPEDFNRLSPEGGCDLKCVQRLTCGHACVTKCHSDVLHAAVKCLEPCPRPIKGCKDHSCPNVCGDACPTECKITIPDVQLPCRHHQSLPCFLAKHPEDAKCKTVIDWQSPACKHNLKIKCYERGDASNIQCDAECGAPLDCGHTCKRYCGECHLREGDRITITNHGTCKQFCGRPYVTCSHSCQALCHPGENCSLCNELCDVRCSHSMCKKKCSEPCTPCAEEHCSSNCPHQRCNMPCAVPCDWLPCSKRCEQILSCGHQCPSVCGESCPSMEFCQVCCSDDIKNEEVDYIEGQTYREVDLDGDPCIFPPCGHILTMSSMDGTFSMSAHYAMDVSGTITAIQGSSEPFSSKDFKRCPKCRGSLRTIARYGRLVRRALLDESTRRLLIWAQREYIRLEEGLLHAEREFANPVKKCVIREPLQLVGSRVQFSRYPLPPDFVAVYKKPIEIRRDIAKFLLQVQKEEQPYQRVQSLVENAHRRKGVFSNDVPEDMSTVHMGHFILATSLSLRCDLALLSKLVTLKLANRPIMVNIRSGRTDLLVNLTMFRNDCTALVRAAASSHQPAQQVEGHILFARFAALEMTVLESSRNDGATDEDEDHEVQVRAHTSATKIASLREQGLACLELANGIREEYPSQTKAVANSIKEVEKMLVSCFYTEVSNEERLQVLAAMEVELRGTGHWYYCRNGHPFSIGNCGMPMEEARCPTCNAPIGGTNHQAVEGVTRADDLDAEVARMRL